MTGNFDAEPYSLLEKDRVFDVMSRLTVYNFLEKKRLLHPIEDQDRMLSFLESGEDGRIILLNRRRFDVPMWHLRWLLSRFEFYFALPGVVMPLCHNIIEAMSAGAIPFLQEEYASLFTPPLENGIHAITFRDKDDLESRLNDMFHLSGEKTSFMRENIHSYYQEHLTPRSVVKRIENAGQNDKIYLQAEGGSVKVLKQRLRQAAGTAPAF